MIRSVGDVAALTHLRFKISGGHLPAVYRYAANYKVVLEKPRRNVAVSVASRLERRSSPSKISRDKVGVRY